MCPFLNDMMQIIQLKGKDKHLYRLLAPLVMDPEVIRANNNYPFKAGDITGGLPRVTELFEARNPSNPAVVSEIDGEVTMGKIKRGNREIIVTSKTGEVKKYLVALSKQILVLLEIGRAHV